MRRVVLILVVGCGMFLGCARPGVATQTASRAERPDRRERPKYPAERVLIVLDASASMGQQGADAMLQSTQAILDSLSLKDQFSLAMTSRGQVYLYKPSYESVSDETVDAALQWAANQPTGGATDLAGAIQAVLSLRGENKGRANLILLTDGQNNIDLSQPLVKPSQLQGLTIWSASPAVSKAPRIYELSRITGGRIFPSACGKHAGRIAGMRRAIGENRRDRPTADPQSIPKPKLSAKGSGKTLAETDRRRRDVEKKLAARVSARLVEQEFPAVVEYFREVSQVNVYVNWDKLANDNPEIRTHTITLSLKNVTIAKLLEVILAEAGGGLMKLDYVIEAGVIRIATRERLNEKPVIRMYNVRDLVHKQYAQPALMPADMKECFCEGHAVSLRFARTWGEKPACPANPRLDEMTGRPLSMQLLELIKLSVANDSWYPNGMATIAMFDGVLVVSQTPENHREIRKIVEHLRRYARSPANTKAYRSVESIHCPDGQLAPWAKQLLQAVADGTLSPYSTLVWSTRNGVTTVKIDGVDLVVPAKGKANPKGKTK